MLASRQIGSTSYPVFSKNFRRLEGKDAWRNNLELAALAASKVASCLGPTGAYKLVTYHLGPKLVTKVTKDAVDIVDELGVQYPAVKTLAEAAQIHRDEAGDGVSTLLVLVSALLNEAQKLTEMGVHPVAILDGYREAAKKSISIIDEIASEYSGDLQDSLLRVIDCGRGLLNKRLREDLVQAMNLVEHTDGLDLGRIKIEKKLGGATEDSGLVRGIIIKKEKRHRSMPDRIDPPRVALVYKQLVLRRSEQLAINEGPFNAKLSVQELEKIVRNGLLVLKHSRARSKVVPGGGAVLAELAIQLGAFALGFSGKQQLAVKAFADALETIPRWLAFNFGLDPIDIMTQLREHHSNHELNMGVGEGGCTDVYKENVVELASIFKTTLWRTLEVASLLLKIDDYFYVKDLPIVHKQ